MFYFHFYLANSLWLCHISQIFAIILLSIFFAFESWSIPANEIYERGMKEWKIELKQKVFWRRTKNTEYKDSKLNRNIDEVRIEYSSKEIEIMKLYKSYIKSLHEIEEERKKSKILNHSNFTFETRMKIQNSALFGCHFITWPSAIDNESVDEFVLETKSSNMAAMLNEILPIKWMLHKRHQQFIALHTPYSTHWTLNPISNLWKSPLWALAKRNPNIRRKYLYL